MDTKHSDDTSTSTSTSITTTTATATVTDCDDNTVIVYDTDNDETSVPPSPAPTPTPTPVSSKKEKENSLEDLLRETVEECHALRAELTALKQQKTQITIHSTGFSFVVDRNTGTIYGIPQKTLIDKLQDSFNMVAQHDPCFGDYLYHPHTDYYY